jgi:Bacterial Ig-like domain
MKLKKIFSIIAILLIVSMIACKKEDNAGISPTVTITDPANSATGVTLTHLIIATFSEPMDLSTINSGTFTLKQDSNTVPGIITYNGTTATFAPIYTMSANKIYIVTITTGTENKAGNALASNHIFSFTTCAASSITLPIIISYYPLNDVIGAPLKQIIVLTFSEAMDPLTINSSTFTLKQGTIEIPGTIAYYGNTATFTPVNTLASGTIYDAMITNGAKDLAGNALVFNFRWSFTTEGTNQVWQ